MNAEHSREAFLAFSTQLESNARSLDDCIGLTFLGSTAALERADEWSDHDFFLIVKPGTGEKHRKDLSWLPNFDDIAMATRETDHGLKVAYANGHILEFAVFEDAELELAAVTDYSVPVDKQDITPRMAAIAARPAPKPRAVEREFELMLELIIIGVGRARRGETLMAGQFIRSYIVSNLLSIISQTIESADASGKSVDALNPFRRFELRYPQFAARIEESLQKDLDSAARGLLEILKDVFGAALTVSQRAKIAVVERRLGWQASRSNAAPPSRLG